MRIARIGNMNQPIPATEYGGTQRSMAQMTAFQAATRAHDITLYAPADSTIIDFTAQIAENLGLVASIVEPNKIEIMNADGRTGSVTFKSTGIASIGYEDPLAEEKNQELIALLLEDERQNPFDLIHCHQRGFTIHNLIPAGLGHKTITHQHTPNLGSDYREHRYPVICISQSQAALLKKKSNANVAAVVYHGLDSFTHTGTEESAGYLAWIGRFLENKGAHRAIQIAQAARRPLVIAGTIFEQKAESRPHFETQVAPHITVTDEGFLDRIAVMTPEQVRGEILRIAIDVGQPYPVIFVGAANEAQKQALYGHAEATLFPISWSEPFGRVMIESMACGTPVIGNTRVGDIHCGSVAEVIADGASGFCIEATDEADSIVKAVAAVEKVPSLNRAQVRAIFDRDWTSERVARELDEVYGRFLKSPNPVTRPDMEITEPKP